MYITCLDVEGVLVPEIWIAFAEASGIPELKKTTRDEPDWNSERAWSRTERDPGDNRKDRSASGSERVLR